MDVGGLKYQLEYVHNLHGFFCGDVLSKSTQKESYREVNCINVVIKPTMFSQMLVVLLDSVLSNSYLKYIVNNNRIVMSRNNQLGKITLTENLRANPTTGNIRNKLIG